MKSKQIICTRILLVLTTICMLATAKAQTVSISGTQPVDIGCENKYTASVSNVPQDWTIVDYKWQATFIGPNGSMRYVSSNTNGTPTYTTTSNSSPVYALTPELWVKWDGYHYPTNVQIIFNIRYTTSTNSTPANSQTYYMLDGNNSNSFKLKGIPQTPLFTTTSPTAVQKCCLNNVTYSVTNYGDANVFDQWTYPTGWTLVSQSGNSITLLPDASTGGNVACRVGISTACPAIYKSATVAITRVDPAITIVPTSFKTDLICPNSTYTYSVNPICGATNYNWAFPAGWSINTGQGTNTVSVSTSASAVTGAVSISADFNGCSSANYTTNLRVLNTPPGIITTLFTYGSHCNGIYLCFNDNSGITLNIAVSATDATAYTYRVVAPFYFKNASGASVQSITTTSNYSPLLYCSQANKLSGTMYITPNNCIGAGTEKAIGFTKEADCWCNGTQPYPYAGNSDPSLCITPPSNCGGRTQLGTTLLQETVASRLIDKNKVYPNPASTTITIETTATGKKTINIISLLGQVVHTTTSTEQVFAIDVSSLQAGTYIAEVSNSKQTVFKQKIIITKKY